MSFNLNININNSLILTRFLTVFTFSLFYSCTDINTHIDIDKINQKPIVKKLDTLKGYSYNEITGDSIFPVISKKGDTLITGKKIPIIGEIVSDDSITPPSISILGNPTITPAIKNSQTIPKIKKKYINPDSLKTIEFGKGDSSFVLMYKGDTIPTGKAVVIEGDEVICGMPKITKSLPWRSSDNAISSLMYLDVDQGLNSSYIRCMIQDSKGNMWFGTNGGGVSKYDGHFFTTYTREQGLTNDYIHSIFEDSKGNLWFGSFSYGVSMYDGEKITNYDITQGFYGGVMAIYEDKSGNIWFGSRGGGVIKYDGKYFTTYTTKEGISGNNVFSICEDKNGTMWFGTIFSGLNKFDGDKFVHYTPKNSLNNKGIVKIVEDSLGALWLGTDGGGLNKLEGDSISYITTNEGLSHNVVWGILIDSNNNLWIATRGGGVNKISGDKVFYFTEKEGVTYDDVWSILEDSDGDIWIGTRGAGINKLFTPSFRHYKKEDGLNSHIVTDISESLKGDLWFSTVSGGITMYDGNYFYNYSKDQGLSHNYVNSILVDSKGRVWLGYGGQGIDLIIDKKIYHFHKEQGFKGSIITDIFEDKKGNIWLGTYYNGLIKFDGKQFTRYLKKNRIVSIMEDSKNNLLLTSGFGFYKFDGETIIHYTDKEGLSSNLVYSICEDFSGNIWISTYHGLNRFDGNQFTNFTRNQGLESDDYSSQIIPINNSDFWFLGDPISYLNLKDETFIAKSTFSQNNGLFKDGVGGAYIDSKNRMWIRCGQRLECLKLNELNSRTKNSKPILTKIDINGQEINYRFLKTDLDSTIQNGQLINTELIDIGKSTPFFNYPTNLVLPYDYNYLTFHFSSIDLISSEDIKFSYRIKELGENWCDPLSENKAEYRNIPFGKYSFQLKSKGKIGSWSEVIEYKFEILPPWWHTWWARVLYAVLIFLLFTIILRIRTRKLKKAQKELENKIEIATTELRIQRDEIIDSINYAKRIQKAILPPLKIVREYLQESFILYKPKDIVAGDFYWLEHKEDKVMFAACDCTGHGVPGAMVSVICNNGLNRAVREHNLTDPGKILDKTREIVIQEFEKSEEEVKDGMDIALCTLQGTILHYAGANNPLWIIRKGTEEIEEIKADKQPIGKYAEPTPYTTHQIELQKGDTIYIFSDGYADQFGGEKGKKFKPSNFKKLLLSIQKESLEQQKDIINQAFEDWKGDLEQLDDVCVIGVRI